jgi:ubiquinol-cytochrome c reductase cytochrome c subunit
MLPALLATILALAPPDGRAAYLQMCATCHGADLRGGPNAPGLRGVGAADVDFWVGTGRMPAAVPWIEVGHRGAQLPQATIDAIVAYVTAVQPGGGAIPIVTTGGDAAHGRTLFRENCMHCHGASAGGGAIGDRQWAPALDRATVTQVAEAIRIGPSEMPAFGTAQLSPNDVDDIATYLSNERAAGGPHGLPAASSGPVPEGLLGWIAAGALAVLAYAFSPPRKDRAS